MPHTSSNIIYNNYKLTHFLNFLKNTIKFAGAALWNWGDISQGFSSVKTQHFDRGDVGGEKWIVNCPFKPTYNLGRSSQLQQILLLWCF